MIRLKFIEWNGNPPVGKVAEVELHFTVGPLAGLYLAGFTIWEKRTGGYTVTFPARQYTVNGDRRTFSLLRPNSGTNADVIRDLILEVFANEQHALRVTP